MRRAKSVILLGAAAAALLLAGAAIWTTAPQRNPPAGEGLVPVEFSGGHDTNPVDRGRPVRLIAAALNVSEEVFREAFSHVHPAPGGTHPLREQVRENKEALMAALGPHGVTNERLDEVSNYYRYSRERGEMWPTDEAIADAVLQNGRVISFQIRSGGFGYTSPPQIIVPGYPHTSAVAEISFSQNFDENGSVSGIALRE
jgi:hypothetical protein